MQNIDLITMLSNLSHSLSSVERLVTAISYLVGMGLIISGVIRLKGVVGSGSRSGEGSFSPMAFMFVGACLLYLPTTIHVMSNTIFGTTNVLAYKTVGGPNVLQAVGSLIKVAGIIWFIRGCVVLVHSGASREEDHHIKGMLFLFAGIMAINFTITVAWLSTVMEYLANLKLTIQSMTGF